MTQGGNPLSKYLYINPDFLVIMKGVEIIDLELVKDDDRGPIFQFQNTDSSKLILVNF